MVTLILVLLGAKDLPEQKYKYYDPCTKSIEYMESEDQLTMAFGCSKVNGVRLRSDLVLRGIISKYESLP